MGKLHELLAAEDSVVAAAEKLLAETADKFNKYSIFFTGHERVLNRLKESLEDKAIELAARDVKVLPSTVIDTVDYIVPFLDKALSLKLQKHRANQLAAANIELDGKVVMSNVPVDFLLDLEKLLPRYRALFAAMPTLDPSREWVVERKGVFKTKEPAVTAQTEKLTYPVTLAPATDKHAAQVKEASRDVVVGTFKVTTINGAATTQQKSDLLALCDKLLVAVKQARMRANSVEVKPEYAVIAGLFNDVLQA